MAWLKNKSEENMDSANMLFDNNLYSSCVHCYYYSCFQLIKFVLNNVVGIGYKEQDSEESDSHNLVINMLYDDIKSKEVSDANVFQRVISDLKYLRTKADYKNVEILKRDAQKAKDKSESIIKLIKQKYMS